jgi:CubicO group peptidase (beta-lactamase class C family)
MKNLFVFSIVLLTFLLACSDNPTEPDAKLDTLQKILTNYRSKGKMPAISGAIINNGEVETYAEGYRKIGSADVVTINDKFHIGSNLKAMTATMVAALVEQGKLNWQSKVKDIFPEFVGQIPVEYENVTLHQLIIHRAGIAGFTKLDDLMGVPVFEGSITEQRYQFTLWVFNNSNKNDINNYVYSNAGYVVAAAFAEKVMEKDYETLMNEKIFTQLNITPLYGWPAEGGANQPWGHTFENDSFVPFNPDGEIQFPEIFNPAGNLSLAINDYIKFVNLHINGLNGNPQIISAESFNFLHTAIGDYSCGWLEGTTENGIRFSYHNGSDGTFFAIVLIHPYKKRASIVFTNCRSDNAELAAMNAAIDILENIK